MQDRCAHENYRVTCNYEDGKPRGKSSIVGRGFAPVADAQGDDATQKQAFVRNWIEIHSKRAALVVSPRDVSVQSIACGRQNKNDDCGETLPFQGIAALDTLAIVNRHRYKSRDHQDPDDGDLVGRSHNADSANNCRAFDSLAPAT